MKKLFRRALLAAVCASLVSLASCVHEFPHEEPGARRVDLHISHSLEWEQHDITVSRDGTPANSVTRYHLQVYDPDAVGVPVAETEFTRDDLTHADFTTSLNLPAGNYMLHAWSDFADAASGTSHFFDTHNFGAITYTEPYNGNNELRDAFRGAITLSVPETTPGTDMPVEAELPMERPFARYEILSSDLVAFLEVETGRGMLHYSRGESPMAMMSRLPELRNYRVRVVYSGYMPSVFNNLTNKPIDARTGMAYDAHINIVSDTEASLGFDHVMVNGSEANVEVMLEIYDPTGTCIGRSDKILVPTKRSRNTTVRGRFLTSKATGGIGIDPTFDDEFIIIIN